MDNVECLTPEGLAQVWGKVKGEINKAVSVVYKPGGNKAASELTSSLLVAANLGYVYNLTTEATTTSDWTEGPGKTIAVGTDVGVVAVTENNSTVYKFNAYATKIDLSAYQTKNLSEAIGGQSTVEGSLAALNSGKADKDTDAVEGHLAKFDANGNPVDGDIAINNVAQKDGSYDQMQVGVAKDLASSQSVPAEIVSRNTGGSTSVGKGGTAIIDRIKGKTLAWNQLVSGLPLESGVYEGLTVTNNGDGTYTFNGTTTGTFDRRIANVNVLAGHKYFVRLDVPNAGANFAQAPAFTLDANGRAITTPASSETGLYITIDSGVTLNNVRVTPQVTDLTLAGIADEISIPADFEALYPGYHDYNEGTLISNDASAIETVGFNLWDEEWELGYIDVATGQNQATSITFRSKGFIPIINGQTYYIKQRYSSMYILCYDVNKNYLGTASTLNSSGVVYNIRNNTAYIRFYLEPAAATTTYNHDICINLSDPSRNGQYEPYWKSQVQLNLDDFYVKDPSGGADIHITGGLKSAGSVYDEIVGNKYIKRVGEVDLGTLVAVYNSGNNRFDYDDYNIPSKGSTINLLTKYYIGVSFTQMFGGVDKCVAIDTGLIRVRDTSYSDANTFNAAMSGVMLYYELATPIEYELVEALPTEYRVDSHGTERRLPEDTASSVHAPFCAEITYSTNIKETVENLPKNYINVDSMHAFLAALGTAMNGEWDMRQGNGRFIFTFTPNTNENE